MMYKYLGIIIIFCILLPSNIVLASGGDTTLQTVCQDIGYVFDMVLRFGTAFWILPVILAGKFLTNEVVYGQFMHLDIYLFMFWNLMKNLANYTLAFIFIFKILMWIKSGASNIVMEIGKLLKSLIVAAVLIQISRWSIGALIDMSTLAISTVASFPKQIIEQDANYKKSFETVLSQSYGRSVNYNTHKMEAISTNITPETGAPNNTAHFFINQKLDGFLPSYENVSGPLMIMGMSMMRFMEGYKQPDSAMTCNNIALSTLFRAMILIFYLIPIIVLLVIAIFRMMKLWFYIAFSPFIGLIYGFEITSNTSNDVIPEQLSRHLVFRDLLSLIFQPVMIVGALSIGIVCLSILYSTFALKNTSGQYQYELGPGSSIYTTDSVARFSHAGDNEFYLQGGFVGQTQQASTTPVGYMIIAFLTIMILRGIMKLAISEGVIGDQTLSGIIDQGIDLVEDSLKSSSLIPIPGVGNISWNTAKKLKEETKNKLNTRKLAGVINQKNEEQANKFASMFGVENPGDLDLSIGHQNELTNQIKTIISDNYSKGKLQYLSDMHDQTRNVFGSISTKIKGKRIAIARAPKLMASIKEWYNRRGAQDYLKAIGVLDLNESTFQKDGQPIADTTQITNLLFDYSKAQPHNSQGRLIQFINLALKYSDIFKIIPAKITKQYPNMGGKISDLAKQKSLKEFWTYDVNNKDRIVTDSKHSFDTRMIQDPL